MTTEHNVYAVIEEYLGVMLKCPTYDSVPLKLSKPTTTSNPNHSSGNNLERCNNRARVVIRARGFTSKDKFNLNYALIQARRRYNLKGKKKLITKQNEY